MMCITKCPYIALALMLPLTMLSSKVTYADSPIKERELLAATILFGFNLERGKSVSNNCGNRRWRRNYYYDKLFSAYVIEERDSPIAGNEFKTMISISSKNNCEYSILFQDGGCDDGNKDNFTMDINMSQFKDVSNRSEERWSVVQFIFDDKCSVKLNGQCTDVFNDFGPSAETRVEKIAEFQSKYCKGLN